MTDVQAVLARSFSPDMFADLTDAVPTWDRRAGVMSFDAVLTEQTVGAIWERMTSRDDADQAERAKITAALNGGATNLTQMLAERELGLPVRDPIYPPIP